MKQVIEESQKDGSKIIKDLVVGFLIVRSKVKNGNSYINVIPLNSSWNGFNDDHDLDVNEEIVGVIPAPQGSYNILGFSHVKIVNKDILILVYMIRWDMSTKEHTIQTGKNYWKNR